MRARTQFALENGSPVLSFEAIAVAGKLKDMLTRIEALGNDLLVQSEVFSPTFRVGKMGPGGSGAQMLPGEIYVAVGP